MATNGKPKICSRYDYACFPKPEISFDMSNPSSRSVTNQSDLDSTDINKIMARYEKTGLLVDDITGAMRKPSYGDFSEMGDYFTVKNRLIKVEQAFNALPPAVRARFENNPQQLVEFLANPQNDKEAVKLGLKDVEVLKTALADDGVTKIFPEERRVLDEKAAAAAAAAAGATGA